MTTHSQWPTATRPGALGNPVARFPAAPREAAARRRVSALARAWNSAYGAWLSRRLVRLEAELQARAARLSARGGDGRPGISPQDLADLEGCCMERAVLLARLGRCRSLS